MKFPKIKLPKRSKKKEEREKVEKKL